MLLENYDEKNVKGASIELRLGSLFRHKQSEILDENSEPEEISLDKDYKLKKDEFLLGKTIEKINMPLNLGGILLTKTVYFRLGIDISSGFVDPGYHGELVFGIKNVGENAVILKKNMILVKLICLEVKGATIPLLTKYMGGRVI